MAQTEPTVDAVMDNMRAAIVNILNIAWSNINMSKLSTLFGPHWSSPAYSHIIHQSILHILKDTEKNVMAEYDEVMIDKFNLRNTVSTLVHAALLQAKLNKNSKLDKNNNIDNNNDDIIESLDHIAPDPDLMVRQAIIKQQDEQIKQLQLLLQQQKESNNQLLTQMRETTGHLIPLVQSARQVATQLHNVNVVPIVTYNSPSQ